MTDRELLELAAKAAGVFLTPEQFATQSATPWRVDMNASYDKRKGCMVGYRAWYGIDGDIGGWEIFEWNPLTNDGDALRLAVALGMNVYHAANSVYALDADGDIEHKEPHGKDKIAATRRAIVRAASFIGEAK